ncbi:hypothetical protein WR25_15755 [Diploscapter pachys]|uniref:Protein kinase C n=1 Tax=Diploscapter pachys TaxID=2018661 RepID=A0A2A2J545_9BILA|nr:hypothetical protein WR25_15755 [Diploscapter pachys]
MGFEEDTDIKLKTRFLGQVVVLYARPPLQVDSFFSILREACKQPPNQSITVKWIDEDGDPVSIDTQMELDEAFRCMVASGDSELNIHVFVGKPQLPGLPCQGEDKNVYRRGARRYKKTYLFNGHHFQAKRLNRRIQCYICHDSIWGIGRQGFRCVDCRLCVHKKCHRLVRMSCGQTPSPNTQHQIGHPLMPLDHSSLGRQNGRGVLDGLDNKGFHEAEIVTHNDNRTTNVTSPRWAVSISDFRLLTVIGRGSYAKVVQAEHLKTKQIYAIKIIKKQMFLEDEDIDWVQTEKSVFEAASNYPFLVGLHSCFQTESRLFFVIEFVPGGDLMFHMQRQRKLPEEHARDLKLDNVLIDAEGHIKLTDYGMCKENIGPGDVTSTFCGTPNYIAPEILRGEDYGFSVDWWALGVLMYEMMAGRSPFDIDGMANNGEENTEDYLFQIILEKQIRIPRSLSVKAASVLKQFLEKEPIKRLGCKTDIDEALHDMQNHAFFKDSIDWEKLETKQVIPPYNPTVTDDRDLQHFDAQFTEEEPRLTPDDENVIQKIDQSEFDGFEYVNPLHLSREDSV